MDFRTYQHPQGATIHLYEDGSIVKYGKNGKPTKTSATAAKLRAGHGGWLLVEDGAVSDLAANYSALSAREEVPGGVLRVPMKFKSGKVEDLPKYVEDSDYLLEQKLDGVRAQIVFPGGGEAPWVRSGSGEVLKSTTAAPVVLRLMKAFADWTRYDREFSVDGEIVGGEFWCFDLIETESEDILLYERLQDLEDWYSEAEMEGASGGVRLLHSAYTREEKAELVDTVIEGRGEGFIVKSVESSYIWGGRVDHSLKIKLVKECDCVVMERNVKGSENIVLGLWEDGVLKTVGRTSAIGKGNPQVGDVCEVQYLYASGDSKLVQPTVLRIRDDKRAEDCGMDQLVYVNKQVLQ